MAYSFDNFKAYMKVRFGQRPDLEDVDGNNMFEVWLKEAQTWLTTRNRFWDYKLNFYFPELEVINTDMTTSTGVAYVTEPASTYIIREAFDKTNSQPLNWMHPKDYIRRMDRADSNARSHPLEWTRLDGSVYFWPTPDGEYNIEALQRKYATAFSAGDDTSGIGPEWDSGILALAAHLGHTAIGEDSKADRAKGLFLDHIEGVIGIYYQESKAGHKRLGMNPYAKNYEF